MSFLAPLYALGLLAVAGPILFHLIRRRPKGEVPFSSLMFLTPSPPPPARKRRVDQLLLLLLRSAVLILLGIAFMRPFLRQDATAEAGEAGQRVVVLIDMSASMRRGDLWKQAVAKADAAMAECKPTDRLAVFAFDRTVRSVFGFAESDQLEPQQRLAVARDRVKQLAPSWGGTELGPALIEGVTAILDADAKGATGSRAGKVVLVSDLPQGAKLTGLTGFEWPAEVGLELRTVSDDRGNAGLDLLVDRADAERGSEPGQLRVRVVNDAGSRNETFQLAWAGTTGADIETYVPPGESRVVKVSRPPTGSTPTLKLRGDAHEFDNALFLATQQREEPTVVFVGTDAADDATGLRYFLDRAWAETPERKVTVMARKPDETLTWEEVKSSPLAVVFGEPSTDNGRILTRYLNDGGTVLVVLPVAGTFGESRVEEANVARYAMLQDIAFDHPLFAPLSGPQYSDFTKVQFWKHRRIKDLKLGSARVLARFDDGDPAVLEKTIEKGRMIVFAAGWQPSDSQLARSSKFVPLMTALLELRGGRRVAAVNYRVGDRVPVVSGTTAVRKPDGITVALDRTATAFDGTDQPGVYTADAPTGPRAFAVNLDPAESLTSPLPPETLEQLGCKLAKRGENEELRRETERQQRNAEMERSQSIWRWLVVAAVAVLLIETGLAGWRTWSNPQSGSAP
jgi:Aerotolerance regulator N-terminal/von Willebrand factor type A domain